MPKTDKTSHPAFFGRVASLFREYGRLPDEWVNWQDEKKTYKLSWKKTNAKNHAATNENCHPAQTFQFHWRGRNHKSWPTVTQNENNQTLNSFEA